jgi:hypothetical protein
MITPSLRSSSVNPVIAEHDPARQARDEAKDRLAHLLEIKLAVTEALHKYTTLRDSIARETKAERDVTALQLAMQAEDDAIHEQARQLIRLGVNVDAAGKAAPPAHVATADSERDAIDIEHETYLTAANKAIDSAQNELDQKQRVLEAENIKLSAPASKIAVRLASARQVRCRTAYCWGGHDGTEAAFEPLLDIPIGVSFALLEGGALASFANSNDLSLQFTAGLRFWFWNDIASIAIYVAKPVYLADSKVKVTGSDFEHPTTAIRRLGPSLGLGLFGDILFLRAGFDQLRNGATPGSADPRYPPNKVLSQAITVTIGIAPFTAARNAAGVIATGGDN